jgi:hypothetical protein
MNNAKPSNTVAQSPSVAALQTEFSQLHTSLNAASEVVICPLSLPDANWPEGLKHLNVEAKTAFSELLHARTTEIFNFDDLAVQKIGVGEALIFELLGFKAPDNPAAFTATSLAPPYIAIRPVSLHAGRDHVVLKQSDGSYASDLELDQLAAAVKPLFEQYGLALHTPYSSNASPQQRARWFVAPISEEGKQFFELATSDSQQALGRNIDAYMAKGQSARRWRQLETEIQMTWFDHPVNSALRSKNLDELNSIWIDGSIRSLPEKPQWLQCLASHRPSLNELANFWELPAVGTAASLKIIDAWQGRLYGDALSWLQAWESFFADNTNLAPNKLVVFAGETSIAVVKPRVDTIVRKVSSFLQFRRSKDLLFRPEICKAFGL